jgi:hypothetical protein
MEMTRSDWQDFKEELRKEFKEGFQQSIEQYCPNCPYPQQFEEFKSRNERNIQSIEEKLSGVQISVARLETALHFGNKMMAIIGTASVTAIAALVVKLMIPAA